MRRFPFALAILCGASPWAGAAEINTAGLGQCEQSQYKASALILSCGGAAGTLSVQLKKDGALSIASFPAGARDVEITFSMEADFDMQLIDRELGKCIVGFDCQHQQACASEDDYCIGYESMSVYFSGDDEQAPVREKIKIKGELTRAMDVAVFAEAAGMGTVSYSYSALASCPAILPGCTQCKDYTGCFYGSPFCDGTATVACHTTTTSLRATTTSTTTLEAATLAPTLAATLAPAPASTPCSTVAPQITGFQLSGGLSDPEPRGDGRGPSFKHGLKEILNNMTAGAVMVGGKIKQSFDNAGQNLVERVDDGYAKTRYNVNQDLQTVKQGIEQRLENLKQGIKQDIEHVPTMKPANFDWNQPLIIGKEQTTKGQPTDRSQHQVPLLSGGRWILSLFQSWTAPGTLCAIGLLSMVLVLFSSTSVRCCVLARGYGTVVSSAMTPRAAAAVQSREIYIHSEAEAGEVQANSRAQLLLMELEEVDVE